MNTPLCCKYKNVCSYITYRPGHSNWSGNVIVVYDVSRYFVSRRDCQLFVCIGQVLQKLQPPYVDRIIWIPCFSYYKKTRQSVYNWKLVSGERTTAHYCISFAELNF